jgi:hypothetical protein
MPPQKAKHLHRKPATSMFADQRSAFAFVVSLQLRDANTLHIVYMQSEGMIEQTKMRIELQQCKMITHRHPFHPPTVTAKFSCTQSLHSCD